jgi:hypothetical protein
MTAPVSVGDNGLNVNPPDGEGPVLTWLKNWADGLAANLRANAEAAVLQAEQSRLLATPTPVPLTAGGVVPASDTLYLDLGAPQLGRRWLTRLIAVASGGASGAGAPAQSASYTANGSVTDPGAFGAIAFTGTVPQGTYTVTATVFLSGTVTAADGSNMELVYGGASPIPLAYPGADNVPITTTVVVTVPAGGHTVGIQAINAASGAAAVYNASLVVTPVSTSAVPGTADWYIGQVPASVVTAPASAWRWRLSNLPSAETFSNEQLPVLPTDHLYCAISAGTAGAPMVASAIVLDYPTTYARAITTT